MVNHITVIMYHYVREIKNSKHPNIKGLELSNFKSQLEYLKKNYTIISAEDLISLHETRYSFKTPPCLLTFDDGYSDHYNYVYPLLKRHKIKGAFYPSAITSKEEIVLDINKIHYLMDQVPDINILIKETDNLLKRLRKNYNIESTEILYKKYAVANRFDSKDIVFFKRLLQLGLPKPYRKYILNHLMNQFLPISESELSKKLYMSISDLNEMKRDGMHIGSHCYDHFWLNTLNYEDQTLQIKKSLDFLNEIGVYNDYSIAYPSGGYNKSTLKILKNYDFKFALTTVPSTYRIGAVSNYEIPRLDTNDFPK